MISNVEVFIEQYPQVRMDWCVQYREPKAAIDRCAA